MSDTQIEITPEQKWEKATIATILFFTKSCDITLMFVKNY